MLMLCSAAGSRAVGQASVGDIAPSFARADLSGKMVSLSEFRGEIVLLNFWATWCGPCLAEIPTFDRLQRQFGSRGVKVVGISMDDTAAPVRKAYAKYRMDYPVVMGDEHLGERYGGVLGVPVTFLINRQGVVVRRYEGPVDPKRLESDLQKLMATQK